MYLIVCGKVGVYKPDKYLKMMTGFAYINWLKQLREANKITILKMNLHANEKKFAITLSNLDRIDQLIYILNSEEDLLNLTTVNLVKEALALHKVDPLMLNLDFDSPILTNNNVSNKIYDYFCSAEFKQLKDNFWFLLKLNREDTFEIVYEHLALYLDDNQYFGDLALDRHTSTRSATVIMETDCIFGVIKENVYREFIFMEKKKIRNKEMKFILTNFFFTKVDEVLFNRNYFDLFIAFQEKRGAALIKQNDISEYAFFVKSGKLKLSCQTDLIKLENFFKAEKDYSFELGFWGSRSISELFVKHKYPLLSTTDANLIGFEEFQSKSFVDAIVVEEVSGFKILKSDLKKIVKENPEIKSEYEGYIESKKEMLRSMLKIQAERTLENIKMKLEFKGEEPRVKKILLKKKDEVVKSKLKVISLRGVERIKRKAVSPTNDVFKAKISKMMNSEERQMTTNKSNSRKVEKVKFLKLKSISPDTRYEQKFLKKIKSGFAETENFLPQIGFLHKYVKIK